ncbi:MAG: hypothetical protein QHC90_23570 [Shinella sp.]|nr:hypothetical protein [Shinella sp.]
MGKRSAGFGAALRILCALAVLFVGFAHKTVDAARLSPLEIASYTLPDGTVPDLCVKNEAGPVKKHTRGATCEACRIGASMLVPVPSDLAGIVLPYRLVADRPLVDAAGGGVRFEPGAPPRAPPFLSA